MKASSVSLFWTFCMLSGSWSFAPPRRAGAANFWHTQQSAGARYYNSLVCVCMRARAYVKWAGISYSHEYNGRFYLHGAHSSCRCFSITAAKTFDISCRRQFFSHCATGSFRETCDLQVEVEQRASIVSRENNPFFRAFRLLLFERLFL